MKSLKTVRFLAGAMLAPLALAAQNPKTQPTTHKPQPTGAAITAGDLETRLYIYAADSMEGRETGTRGHVRATDYIAAQVKALGLVPMGDNGTYFQNVPVIRRSLDPASTISAPGVTLHAGTDFIATGRGNVRSLAEAPIIYGGVQGDTTGALTPEQVQGKVIAYRAPAGARSRTRRIWGRWPRRPRWRQRCRSGAGARGGRGRSRSPTELSEAQVRAAMHPREGDVQLKADASDSASGAADHHHARRGRATAWRLARRNGQGNDGQAGELQREVRRHAGAGAQRRRRVSGTRRQAQERMGRDGGAQRPHRDSPGRADRPRLAAPVRAGRVSDPRAHRALQPRESHLRRTPAGRMLGRPRPRSSRTSIRSTRRSRRSTSTWTACAR